MRTATTVKKNSQDASGEMMSEETTEFSPPLPSGQLSLVERVAILSLIILAVVLLVGVTAWPQIFWDGFLEPLVWEPIIQDADVGDSGYTPQNTALFIAVLFAFVITISAIFRITKIPSGGRMLIAFLPWIVWAPVVRVLEDSQYFQGNLRILFISPIIHFHIALWVLFAIMVGRSVKQAKQHWVEETGELTRDDSAGDILRVVLLCTLVLMFAVLVLPSFNAHEGLGTTGMALGVMLSVIVGIVSLEATREWDEVERAVFSIGMGAVALFLGLWLQFIITPWHQGGDSALWPVLVVLGIPTIVVYILWQKGEVARAVLASENMSPGVLPPDISIKQNDEGEWEGKDIMERWAPMALIGSPWALTIAFGQLTDGLATWIGIDVFGYSEKHPLSNWVIEQGVALTGGDGAWLFFFVKACLVALLLWVFSAVRIEHRQQHLRLLIVLALLVVGLAPGLRDLGRLLLGV